MKVSKWLITYFPGGLLTVSRAPWLALYGEPPTNTRVESTNTSEKEPLRFTWYQFKEICLAYLIKDLINRTVWSSNHLIYKFSTLGLLFHVCGEAVVNVSANRRDRQVGTSLVVQSFCWLPCPWLLLVGLVAWFSLTVVGWICCLLFFGLH